jgi:serine/threonine protein kinase
MNSKQAKSAPASAAASAAAQDDLVVGAVREYLALVEAGERPDRRAFAKRYPDIESALDECLGGLDFLNAAVSELSDGAASPVGRSHDDRPHNGMLGEFRLLREIGRGGMGIVYEAEQVSLGRRVALKMLPFASALDAKQLQRFKNEAKPPPICSIKTSSPSIP